MNFRFFKIIVEEIKYLQGFWMETGKYLFFSDGQWRSGSLGANGGLEQSSNCKFQGGWRLVYKLVNFIIQVPCIHFSE